MQRAADGSSVLLLPLLLVVAAAATYANSVRGPFVFDDVDAIVENPHIRSLWPPGRVLTAPPQATVAGRPLVSLSLALNYAVGGLDVRGYHACNIGVHVLAGLLIYGIIRRTLRSPTLRDRFAPVSSGIAWSAALIWLVHPLGSETVNYVVQRTESIMALFFLLTVYCAIRAAQSKHRVAWSVAAVAACALGMASKEVMVTAPVIVWLYDRSYHPDRQARWGLYAGLAATWIVLGALMLGGPRSETVGTSLGLSALGYAKNQCVVVLDYLRHVVWPRGLVFDYGFARPIDTGAVLPYAVILALVVSGTVILWLRRPALGFPALAAFVVLAPTSSVVPIVSEVGAERRMYLPLAGLTTLAVVAAYLVADRLPRPRSRGARHRAALVVGLAVAAALAWSTARRNEDYRSELSIWRSAVAARPLNARAHNSLGLAVQKHLPGSTEQAVRHYRRALELDEHYARAHYNLGTAMAELGRADEALAQYRRALELNPALPRAHHNLGSELANRGRLAEALPHFREAARLAPHLAPIQHALGRALRLAGRAQEALGPLREAARLDPSWPEPRADLAWILATHPDERLRDPAEARRLALEAVALAGEPRPVLLDTLAAAYAAAGEFDRAVEVSRQARFLALHRGEDALAAEIEERLRMYGTGEPYREPRSAPDVE